MTQPNLILTPFANNAAPGLVNSIAESAGAAPENATWQGGFPNVTMQPVELGGIPPQGQDFNGLFKALSEHIVFQNKGGKYKFVDGTTYDKGSVLLSDDDKTIYISLIANNSTNFNSVPGSIGTQWAKIAGTTGWVTLSDSINSSFSNIGASSKAVKTAYDKGVEALNAANNAQTTADNAGALAGNAVPKADISDAIDSSSSDTVGSSKAVKTAYDKGVDALNAANSAQTTADTAVANAATAHGIAEQARDDILEIQTTFPIINGEVCITYEE